MTSLIIGQIVACKLTLWMQVKFINKALPHSYVARCKVESIERHVVDTLAPRHIVVDCRKDLQWIDTDHRGKTKLLSIEYGEDGCYE